MAEQQSSREGDMSDESGKLCMWAKEVMSVCYRVKVSWFIKHGNKTILFRF